MTALISKSSPFPGHEFPEKEIDLPFKSTFAKISYRYDEFARQAGLLGYLDQVYPHQKTLVTTYVIEAFRILGCPIANIPSGQTIALGPGCVHPRHKKLVHGLYGILQEAGIVSIRVGDGVAIRTAVPVDPAPSRELQNMLLDSFPLYSAELELLNITGPQLASCLYGRRDPIDLLLNDQRGRDLLSQFYLNGPLCATGSRMLCEFLADILASRKEKVKILEIGAGTGGTSKIVIDQLRRMNNVSFEYCFTDISPTLVAAAKQQFELSDYYPFMSFMVLDIENPPPESSELLGQYDIVISTNCIHATKSLVESTANIRRILRRPGGLLCLVEGTRPLVWCDIVFGLLDGWWAFEDGRTQALTDELVWKESLMKAGYEYVAWSTGESRESDCLRLIVATASGDT